jgi:YVTN family beta-propeller protein
VYDAATQRVFALNGHGHSATVIDARTNAVVATIPLGGKPEFARSDNQGHLLVNIEDTAELVTLDTKAATVTARWPLPHCEEPTGLAFDIAHHRSFSTCGNQVLAVLDTSTGHAIASVPIGKGVDGAEFDSATQTLFSANGEGNITVVREQDPDHYTVLQTLQTQRGARTIALDVTTHRLYSPTAEFGAPVAPSADNPRGRPPVLPGTFVVLVVANPSPSSSVEAAGACSQDREYLVVQ